VKVFRRMGVCKGSTGEGRGEEKGGVGMKGNKIEGQVDGKGNSIGAKA